MTGQRAAGLATVLELARTHAEEAEQAKRLSPVVITEMRQAGLFAMCVPKSIGGAELDPLSVLDAIEQLSAVDGAAGWSAMIAATSGCVSGHLPPAAAREIYTPDGLVVGPFAPLGRATRTPAGYQVSGRWPFASMCEQSSWIMAGTVVEGGQRRLMFAPSERFRVHPTWSVMGLCATGSHDVELEEVTVAEHRSVPLSFDAPHEPGPLYVFPVMGLLAASIATVSLGIASGALTYLTELAGQKTPTYSVRRLSERPAVQVAIATSLARLRAARGLLYEAVEQAWQQACEDGAVRLDERLALRLAAVHTASTAADVVTEMYRAGGGSSIYLSNPGQRRLRDVHTATQHAMVSPAILEVVGRRRLGLRVDEAQF
ncbi:MAG: acyl-CoA dehydrogenase family protein [Jatrophihabitans sp.]